MANFEQNICQCYLSCKHYYAKKRLMIRRLPLFMECRKKLRFSRLQLAIILFIVIFCSNYLFGISEYAFSRSFSDFEYPLSVNIPKLLHDYKNDVKIKASPLNHFDFGFRINNIAKCQNPVSEEHHKMRLLFVVKSAAGHYKIRAAIRKTWGFENRFSDVPIRTVFVLGEDVNNTYTQKDIENENSVHHDIIQGRFIDSYFNNTLKTMTSLKWAMEHCKGVNVFAFVDDDYYVSAKKLLKYLRNPFNEVTSGPNPYKVFQNRKFFGGYVFPNSAPQRFKFSKWHITREEYPYSRWPPYVTGGAFLLSYQALEDLVITSFYTKKFRFDDIFLGILAKRAEIPITHIEHFQFWESMFFKLDYNKIIAAHGFKDPEKLVQVWMEQKSNGNA